MTFEFTKKPPRFVHPQFLETMELLRTRGRSLTYEYIAEECEFTTSWLQQLAAGLIADPSVHKILRLRDFLLSKADAEKLANV